MEPDEPGGGPFRLPPAVPVTRSHVGAIASRHGVEADRLEPLASPGIINTVYRLGQELVLRVPRDHEGHIAQAHREACAIPAAVAGGVRTPRLVAFDDSREILPVPFLIVEARGTGRPTSIAYWTTGTGPPLVAVHGTPADHTRWQPLLPYLEPHFTVHAIDRRGRGPSGDASDYEDVAAVVDALAAESKGRVSVYGHSHGGIVAFGAATLTANVHTLVLYEGWPVPDPRCTRCQPSWTPAWTRFSPPATATACAPRRRRTPPTAMRRRSSPHHRTRRSLTCRYGMRTA